MRVLRYFNFYKPLVKRDEWFNNFLISRKINLPKRVNFYSVFGPRLVYYLTRSNHNIFFSGENLNVGKHIRYKDYFLNNGISLSLGFDYLNHSNYLRFPLWILYFVKPYSGFKEIKNKIDSINNVRFSQKENFCGLVSSHDKNNLRTEIYNELSSISKIYSGGKLLHNDERLHGVFKNNKVDYLKQFKFNICPENSNSAGYVTEKVFQAIEAGCIPIYWGSNNNPEPDILNEKAIIFWNKNENNAALTKKIQGINSELKFFNEFKSEPIFKVGAADVIFDYMSKLEKKFKDIFK